MNIDANADLCCSYVCALYVSENWGTVQYYIIGDEKAITAVTGDVKVVNICVVSDV